MSSSILNLGGLRRLPILRQAESAECGLACLAMIAGYHGYEADLATLRRRFAVSMKGATLKSLMELAAGLGLGSRALRCELDELREVRTPAIIHWELSHYVVLKRVGQGGAEIHDPAIGARLIPLAELSRKFTGVVLELTPTDGFQRKRERHVLRLGTLVKWSPDTFKALVQALVLSILIELLVLTSPFYMQLVIDEAILKGDHGLLTGLAVGFSFVAIFNVAATAMRGLVIQFLGNVLSFEMEARLFHHLLRLPLDWFQKRQMGDVQSRFKAIDPIKHFVAGGAIAAVFDAMFGLFTLVLMFVYAPTLSTIACLSCLIYAGLRLVTLDVSRRVAGDLIVADAKQQTLFLETLRAAQTLKVSGAENIREAQQRNAIAATLNAGIRAGNVNLGYAAVNQSMTGLIDILIVFIGATAVMAGDMTVGMLTAFLIYKGQFVGRMTRLLECAISWRLLDVQLERVADIALHPREPKIDTDGHDGVIQGRIEASNIFFRYAPGEPDVLQRFSCSIDPGEFVAIAGPSGCGKSTLLKVLTGLYQPSYGEVRLDGRPLSSWSARTVRAQIGVVMQDDVLLQGSIAENIALFEDRVDMGRVAECARLAAIHDDIMQMPMGYHSLVGDMGSALSGGQKQRVMIARALYRRPRVLFLDEGTSHLDVETERAVNAALAELAITRIVVAHRPDTLRAATRVLWLTENGPAEHLRGLAGEGRRR